MAAVPNYTFAEAVALLSPDLEDYFQNLLTDDQYVADPTAVDLEFELSVATSSNASQLDITNETPLSSTSPYNSNIRGNNIDNVNNHINSTTFGQATDLITQHNIPQNEISNSNNMSPASPPKPVKHARKAAYPCEQPLCSEAFHNKKAYVMHLYQSHGVKYYKCSSCGVSFNRRDNYLVHMKRGKHASGSEEASPSSSIFDGRGSSIESVPEQELRAQLEQAREEIRRLKAENRRIRGLAMRMVMGEEAGEGEEGGYSS